ncbi:MAG TPA: hypothetical protein V6D06_16575, partial [Trichocoleus sp.]
QAQSAAQQAQRGVWANYSLATEPSEAAIDMRPNVLLPVQTQSGSCPPSIGLWVLRQGFEGGADHTVIADTAAIATAPARQAAAGQGEVVFTVPLRPEYSGCVGVAQSEHLSFYSLEMSQGQGRFRLDLSGDGQRQVLDSGSSAGRPYIHWRATE